MREVIAVSNANVSSLSVNAGVALDALADTLGAWWRIVWRVAIVGSLILAFFEPGAYLTGYELVHVPAVVPAALVEDVSTALFLVFLGALYLTARLTTCQYCGDVSSATGECPECHNQRGEVPEVIVGEVIQHIAPEEQGEFALHPHFRTATEGKHILVVRRDDVETSLPDRILSKIPIPIVGHSYPHVVDVAADEPVAEGTSTTVRGGPVTIDVDGTKDATEVEHGER